MPTFEPLGVKNGKENNWIYQTPGACREGEPFSAGRTCFWVNMVLTSWHSAKSLMRKLKDQIGMKIPVVITVFQDKSFSFITKTPPASTLIKKAAGLKIDGKPGTGANNPGREKVGKVTWTQMEEIAKLKAPDLHAYEEKSGAKIIAGTARYMGIDVVDG